MIASQPPISRTKREGLLDRYGAVVRVKTNVAEVLRAELARPSWKRDTVVIGAATDPYQPAEGRFRLTRACLTELSAARNPLGIITRGPLIVRAHTAFPIQVGVMSFSGELNDKCEVAGAYAEMNGRQLAWVASIVPEVAPSWGSSCLTPWNTIGQPAAVYGTGPAAHQDGNYHWNIWCSGPPPPPLPPQDPNPGEDNPPPGCRKYCGPGVATDDPES